MSDETKKPPALPSIYDDTRAYLPSPDPNQPLVPLPYSTGGIYRSGYCVLVIARRGVLMRQVKLSPNGGTMAVGWDEKPWGHTWITLGPTDGRRRTPLGVRLGDVQPDGSVKFGPELFIQYDPA